MNTLKKLLAVSVVAVAAQANAAVYDISGTFPATATVGGASISVPFTVLTGTYDSDTGAGSWSISSDVSAMGFGIMTFDQTFSLDAVTGLGTLNAGTNCDGNAFACAGLAPNFVGPLNAGGSIVAGVQAWTLQTPSLGTSVFTPLLTDVTPTPEVPVPAAAWLFGSGLLGLAGAARRRGAN